MNKKTLYLSGAISGAAGMLVGQSYGQYRRQVKAALERQVDSQVAETAAGLVEYSEWGRGPAVLVLHGAGGGCDQAMFMVRPMGQDFRYIAVSRFGYQRTPFPAEDGPTRLGLVDSPAAQADAYAGLLDYLDVPKVAVVGLSAGGPSALQFALRYPDRCTALIMASAVSQALPLKMPELDLAFLLGFRSDYLDYVMLRLAHSRLNYLMGLSPAVRARFTTADEAWLSQFVSLMMPVSWRREGLLSDKSRLPALERMPLELITAPTLVLHAADDALAPLSQGQFAADTIPNAQLVVLKDGGHLMLTRHDEVLDRARAFLLAFA